jgi:hypothetical protein
MQHKKTPSVELPDDLPELSPREQRFVQLICEGKTATDAYIESHDAAHWKPQSVWAKASRLRNSDRIRQWIDMAKRVQFTETAYTLQAFIEETEELKAKCIKAGNYGAAATLQSLKGKCLGHGTDKVVIKQGEITGVDELFARISNAVQGSASPRGGNNDQDMPANPGETMH